MTAVIRVILWTVAITSAACQSNYASQANDIEYQGDGLPEQTILNGKVTKLDDISPIIFLNRTKAALNCAAGSMHVELKFNERFYGIAYADFDRNSACKIAGNGDYSYRIELPLKGCGTRQDPQRVFTNNIVVRFHPGLEMDGDEVITIVCRYPPPVAPIPPVPSFFIDRPPAASHIPAPLNGLQIMLIICAILFLSLVLLGLGVSYYCLRRRHMTVIRHLPFESGSEITKLSGSSLGNISMFEGLKIPRAQAQLAATASQSGSEGPLISDTIPSDYPSESHSEVEDVDTRSLPVSSTGSFDNKAYVHESYQESYHQTESTAFAVKPPKFNVEMRVKRAPPPPIPSSPSDSESSLARAERNLTTILEQREESSTRTVESPRTQFTYVPDIHPPPKHVQPAPVYSRIQRRQEETREREETREEWTTEEKISRARSLQSLNTEMTDTHSMNEVTDVTHTKLVVPPPPPKRRHVTEESYSERMEQTERMFATKPHAERTVDDRRESEYRSRTIPATPTEKWDVQIRNVDVDEHARDWENFSDVSSNVTLTPKMERAALSLPPQSLVTDPNVHLTSPELVGHINASPRVYSPRDESRDDPRTGPFVDLPARNDQVANWNVLIRILRPSVAEDEKVEQLTRELSMSDQMKWRKIITTESHLRTLLSEAVIREDFERIRTDKRYENLFEPQKWDVIIRVLSPPERAKRYKKKSESDAAVRRSSLPTLYEYDSDGSSVRTMTNDTRTRPSSSYRSEVDLRSMSEMIVDFARPDSQSDASSYYQRYYDYDENARMYARSGSQPSLARSASEFTERWIAPNYDSEYSEAELTPRSSRSSRVVHELTDDLEREERRLWQEAAARGAEVKVSSKEYVEEKTTRYEKRGGWFDDESETSFK